MKRIIVICFLLISACKTAKVPIAFEMSESSSNYNMRLTTAGIREGNHQIRAAEVLNRPDIAEISLSKDTPPPSKVSQNNSLQTIDSLKRGDQEASGYNRHQSGSRFVDTLEDLWDAGGIGKDIILIVLLTVLGGIWFLLFGPINQ